MTVGAASVMRAQLQRIVETGAAQALRERYAITRPMMASDIGVTDITLWRWETGRRIPRGALADRWLGILAQLADIEATRDS